MKLAKHATDRRNVVVFDGAFHGRTHYTLAMSSSRAIDREGYGPLPGGVFVAPFPDPHASDQEAEVSRALRGLDRADRLLKPHLKKNPPIFVRNALRLGVSEIGNDAALDAEVTSMDVGRVWGRHAERADFETDFAGDLVEREVEQSFGIRLDVSDVSQRHRQRRNARI
mgnify:CR=1 FL=1